MADTGALRGMAHDGVREGEKAGVGLGVALDVANQAEACVVEQVPHAATSSQAAPMEVEESTGSQPRAMLDNYLQIDVHGP